MRENVDISAAIPIYKGKKYIASIIEMLEVNQNVLIQNGRKEKIEVIFVNDYPDEKIDDNYISSTILKIIFMNNKENCGIHRTRIRALKAAKGAYILFLDQDDVIANDYFYSQLVNINEADAVLCNGIHRQNKLIYANEIEQRRVVCGKGYFEQEHIIISPGQVLIRKGAIPNQWKENILLENGSDDVLLWILMLDKNRRFAINPSNIYTHIEYGDNTSLDFTSMRNSVMELRKTVLSKKLLSCDNQKIFIDAISKRIEKYNQYIGAMNNWDTIVKNITKICKRGHYNHVSVYGYGIIGRKLLEDLRKQKINIYAVVDKDANKYNETKEKMYRPSDIPEEIDLIIITPIFAQEVIKLELISAGYKGNIINIMEIEH